MRTLRKIRGEQHGELQCGGAGDVFELGDADGGVPGQRTGRDESGAYRKHDLADVGNDGGGTPVTITGTGFLSGATVSLGGTAATGVTVVSSTSITATTGAHGAGAVNVVVTNTDAQSGTKTNGYTYTTSNPAPTVSSISPTSGTTAGGTPVTITGTGFLSGATVSLGGTAATGVTVVSSTSITATTGAPGPARSTW